MWDERKQLVDARVTSCPYWSTPSASACVDPDKSSESVDRLLVERFRKLGRFPEAFSSIQYRGTRTSTPPTDFGGLRHNLEQLLDNNATRSPRTPLIIFKALQVGSLTCREPLVHK